MAIMAATEATVSTVVTASFSTEEDIGSRSSKVHISTRVEHVPYDACTL